MRKRNPEDEARINAVFKAFYSELAEQFDICPAEGHPLLVQIGAIVMGREVMANGVPAEVIADVNRAWEVMGAPIRLVRAEPS